jgi:hypothetical protein
MKLLANENFPLLVVSALRDIGHDVLWIRTDMPGAMDDVILQRAQDAMADRASSRQRARRESLLAIEYHRGDVEGRTSTGLKKWR